MSTQHQKIQIDLKGYSTEEREAIAIRVIDQIVKRTKDGRDKNGKAFAGYSKDYKNSAAFKTAGKSSTVDLTLSGDMLDSIQILKNASGKVEIGFERGSTENGKADGNIRGTYGQDKKVGPAREFLGISSRELRDILSDFPQGEEESLAEARKVLKSVDDADKLSGKVNLEDLDE